MMALVYFLLSVALAWNVVGALYPRLVGETLGMLFSVPFLVVTLVLPQLVALGLLSTAVFYWLGALDHPLGQAGLALHIAAWVLILLHIWQMRTTYPILSGQLIHDNDAVFSAAGGARMTLMPMLRFRTHAMRHVDVIRSVVFREVAGVRLKVDIYKPRRQKGDADDELREGPEPRLLPSLIYIHGGAWVIGSRRQSPFMMFELAQAGYVVFAISYRLAPRFPMPAGIEDCKAAIAWVRAHAAEYGGTPAAVVLGGSAGGHLTAMMALSPNEPRFQPGFETADTRIRGAVVFYGLPEFVPLIESRGSGSVVARWLLEDIVFGKRLSDDREFFHVCQPTSYMSKMAPPLLLIHGQNDTLIPVRTSRLFAEALRKAGAPRVELCEIPGAQHAFELAPTLLHQRTMRIVLGFLASLEANDLLRAEKSRTPAQTEACSAIT